MASSQLETSLCLGQHSLEYHRDKYDAPFVWLSGCSHFELMPFEFPYKPRPTRNTWSGIETCLRCKWMRWLCFKNQHSQRNGARLHQLLLMNATIPHHCFWEIIRAISSLLTNVCTHYALERMAINTFKKEAWFPFALRGCFGCRRFSLLSKGLSNFIQQLQRDTFVDKAPKSEFLVE